MPRVEGATEEGMAGAMKVTEDIMAAATKAITANITKAITANITKVITENITNGTIMGAIIIITAQNITIYRRAIPILRTAVRIIIIGTARIIRIGIMNTSSLSRLSGL